jgi:hypothetical protein
MAGEEHNVGFLATESEVQQFQLSLWGCLVLHCRRFSPGLRLTKHANKMITNPNDAEDSLRITSSAVSFVGRDEHEKLLWSSLATREYGVQQTTSLVTASSIDAGLLLAPDSGTNTTRALVFSGPVSQQFVRVQAIKPLAP